MQKVIVNIFLYSVIIIITILLAPVYLLCAIIALIAGIVYVGFRLISDLVIDIYTETKENNTNDATDTTTSNN